MSTAHRVIKNTGYLYAKMGITMFISLYTTRLLLNSLGASDFGIFNVVGGAIAMLGFLNASMAGATQRFMSYYEGKGDKEKQKEIFNISIVLHFVIALILGVGLLIAGYFFFNGILNIPIERIYAAKVVYASLIISTMFTVMTVPYDAVLNAHENMFYYAIVGILESLLKLAVALIVVYSLKDKLIVYGILMAAIPLITLTIMRIYSHRKYDECVIAPRKYWDGKMLKEITGFAGWNFLGSFTSMTTQYGFGIIINIFFGTVINAAQGIANQIAGQLMVFPNTLMKALTPVIYKSEGEGNRMKMIEASLIGSKLSYLLIAFFAIPFLFETPFILRLWLKNVPDYAIIFTRLQILRFLIEQLTFMLIGAINAYGDIKRFTIVKSINNIIPLGMVYFLFYKGFPPYIMYLVWILHWSVIGGGINLFYANKTCNLSYRHYFYSVLLPGFGISVLTSVFLFILHYFLDNLVLRFIITLLFSPIVFIVLYRFFFINEKEKNIMASLIHRIKNKLGFRIWSNR